MADKWKTIATSGTSPIELTKRKEVPIRIPLVILGIHSNVHPTAELTDGHAWLSVSRDGVVTNYGLWPDDHPRIIAMGISDPKKSDIRVGMEDGQPSQAARHYKLSIKQIAALEEKLKENVSWRYTNTCASWASETVIAVTSDNLDANDTLGFETPRQLSASIIKLETKRPTSINNPQGMPNDAGVSISSN